MGRVQCKPCLVADGGGWVVAVIMEEGCGSKILGHVFIPEEFVRKNNAIILKPLCPRNRAV
jgi:hypothetical protein